ncbi:D-aminoacyl-tRNA deacylase [Alcanivorax sp. 1008]|uniref:D-aminoacyl-tRNA deacylase n=1 Tax=Alcanivorax sp. 1008 TaxID=2816853 RepID=UPI001DADFF8D|nr:D-tyrosyl-tRNA(Tyr) deacylase [Alcanivorax sp. 1008]
MKLLLQRVSRASVSVADEQVGAIGRGILALVGFERADGEEQVTRLTERMLNYRLFADEAGKTNLSVRDVAGGVLLVSQFTLAADTRRGLRPGFSLAADPQRANDLYLTMLELLRREAGVELASGIFGADMQVMLVNDGPVTFLLEG